MAEEPQDRSSDRDDQRPARSSGGSGRRPASPGGGRSGQTGRRDDRASGGHRRPDEGGQRRRDHTGDDRRSTGRDGAGRRSTERNADERPSRGRPQHAGRPGERNPRGGSFRKDAAERSPRSRPPQDVRIPDPELPEDITARSLDAAARNQLKTLSKENAEAVARHLAMAARLIDDDPHRAHEHALAATRRAGRVAVVRETAAITAYAIGDFALALRELRTYRRISGRDDQIALMVDSERGVGKPDRALEVGRSVDRASLSPDVRAQLAIAMSGARLDRGETERALRELDIPELDPDRAFPWSPDLFSARAEVLEELGRGEEADQWRIRAQIAADALAAASGAEAWETVIVEEIDDDAVEPDREVERGANGEDPAGTLGEDDR